MRSDEKYIHIADIHLGHLRVPANEIVRKLEVYFFPKLADANGVFFHGDVFDRLITLDSDAFHAAINMVHELFDYAHRYGFFIRVLRGTYRHDRYQSRVFRTIAASHVDVNFAYIENDIMLETISGVGIRPLTVLYLPDNLPYGNTTEVMTKVSSLVKNAKVSVDLVSGHGNFDFALPKAALSKQKIVYTADDFSFVNGFVIMGHIHTHKTYKHVAYCSSFDRLAHGEEEPKGFLVTTRNKDRWTLEFVPNRDATIFNTLRLKGDDLESLVNEFQNYLQNRLICKTVPTYLKVFVESREIAYYLMKRFDESTNSIFISFQCEDLSHETESIYENSDKFDVTPDNTLMDTTPEAFSKMIYDYITAKYTDQVIASETVTARLEALRTEKDN